MGVVIQNHFDQEFEFGGSTLPPYLLHLFLLGVGFNAFLYFLLKVSILSTSPPSFPSGMEESTLLGVMLVIGLIGGSDFGGGIGTLVDVCVLGLAPS